jgi:hypothetical protein
VEWEEEEEAKGEIPLDPNGELQETTATGIVEREREGAMKNRQRYNIPGDDASGAREPGRWTA